MKTLLLGYIGQRKSQLTENYFLGNGYRNFNPVIKRFFSWDSLSPFDIGGVQGYAYCQANPVNLSDKSGEGPLIDLLMFTVFSEAAEIGTGVEAIAAGETAVAIERRLPDVFTPIKDGFRIENMAGEINDVSTTWLREEGRSFITQYMDVVLDISGEWDSEHGVFRGASGNVRRKADKIGSIADLSDYKIKPKYLFKEGIYSFTVEKKKGLRFHKNKFVSRNRRLRMVSSFESRLWGVLPPPSYESISHLPSYIEAIRFL